MTDTSAVHSRKYSVIACVLLAAFVITIAALAQDKGPAGDFEKIQKSFPVHPGASLSVDNDRGTTTIDTWDKNEVSIEAVKHYEGDASMRDKWMTGVEVRIDGSASGASVKIVRPNMFCIGYCNYHGWVDVTVHTPKKVAVNVKSDRTTTKISGIEGDLRFEGDRSTLELRGTSGGLHLRSDRGSITVRDADVRNDVDIRTDRASVDIYASRFNAGGHIETDRAPITLRIPSDAKLDLEVDRDRRTSFRSDFSLTTSGNLSGYGTMHGSINGGGPTLRMRTDRGSISVERGGSSL